MVKRATDIHAGLAVTRPGDVMLDTDHHISRYHGRRLMRTDEEPIEGIPAFINLDGVAVPLVRAHTEGQDLEDLIRLGQATMTNPASPDKLEVVKFTFRHHVAWIEK